MGKKQLTVLGMMVNDRSDAAPEIQEIITRHGRDIVCRMGIPTQDKTDGLITLIMDGPKESVDGLVRDLQEAKEVVVQTMSF